jgi:hypothetical protein
VTEPAFNPDAAPAETSARDFAPLARDRAEPAKPAQRLGGLVVDALVFIATSMFGVFAWGVFIRLDGSRPGFLRGVVLRSWCGHLPALIPFAGQACLVLDALFVLRPDGRTLRDFIAGTRVVRNGPPRVREIS